MINVLGYVITNMWWQKEAEKLGLAEYITGSVRLNISSVSFDKHTSHNCDYSKGGSFLSETPTLEIIYRINSGMAERLTTGDLVNLSIYNESIYYKPKHFTQIVEVPKGQIKFYHLKVANNKVDSFQYLKTLTPTQPKSAVKSAKEIVNLLVNIPTLELTQPTPIRPFSVPVLKQLELA